MKASLHARILLEVDFDRTFPSNATIEDVEKHAIEYAESVAKDIKRSNRIERIVSATVLPDFNIVFKGSDS